MRQEMIVIRVKGGFVEEISGNPVPVRVYDYDAWYGEEHHDRDEEGRPCIISEHEPDVRR